METQVGGNMATSQNTTLTRTRGAKGHHIQERGCLHCACWLPAALASPSLGFSLDPGGLDNEEWDRRNWFSQGCKIVERLRPSTAFG